MMTNDGIQEFPGCSGTKRLTREHIISNGSKKKWKKPKWKKPHGMPKRPLSAYNLFFAQERQRLMKKQSADICTHTQYNVEKAHPKKPLGFAGLARTVAASWKVLDPETKARFQEQSEVERVRYRREMKTWESKFACLNQKKATPEFEAMSVGTEGLAGSYCNTVSPTSMAFFTPKVDLLTGKTTSGAESKISSSLSTKSLLFKAYQEAFSRGSPDPLPMITSDIACSHDSTTLKFVPVSDGFDCSMPTSETDGTGVMQFDGEDELHDLPHTSVLDFHRNCGADSCFAACERGDLTPTRSFPFDITPPPPTFAIDLSSRRLLGLLLADLDLGEIDFISQLKF